MAEEKADLNELTKLFYEAGMLTRLDVSGDLLVGNSGRSVADHSMRAAMIGYFLAKLEKADSSKVAIMLLFHDLCETRILELNKIAFSYINREQAETKSFEDQLKGMPKDAAEELSNLEHEMKERKSKEAIIAKDADYLECAISAKEAIDKGYDMHDWINNVRAALKTESAKKLLAMAEKMSSNEWWRNLKYIPELKKGDKKY